MSDTNGSGTAHGIMARLKQAAKAVTGRDLQTESTDKTEGTANGAGGQDGGGGPHGPVQGS